MHQSLSLRIKVDLLWSGYVLCSLGSRWIGLCRWRSSCVYRLGWCWRCWFRCLGRCCWCGRFAVERRPCCECWRMRGREKRSWVRIFDLVCLRLMNLVGFGGRMLCTYFIKAHFTNAKEFSQQQLLSFQGVIFTTNISSYSKSYAKFSNAPTSQNSYSQSYSNS